MPYKKKKNKKIAQPKKRRTAGAMGRKSRSRNKKPVA